MKINNYNPLRIMGENGWIWHHYQDDEFSSDVPDDYECFTMEILGEYRTVVRVCVSEYEQHLSVDGHYGVLWLEVAKYENDPPHSERDLYDMIYAIEKAEENLLRIGMPFVPDYKFHGNKANRKRRNEKLRRLYHLEELENKHLSKEG